MGNGGRPRWKKALSTVRPISETAHVSAKDANARQRLRMARTIKAIARKGMVTTPPPATLRKRKNPESTTLRMEPIQSYTR
jgi:hypothetical protein